MVWGSRAAVQKHHAAVGHHRVRPVAKIPYLIRQAGWIRVGSIDGAPDRMTAYTVRVSARYDDAPEMEKLVSIAERGCTSPMP